MPAPPPPPAVVWQPESADIPSSLWKDSGHVPLILELQGKDVKGVFSMKRNKVPGSKNKQKKYNKSCQKVLAWPYGFFPKLFTIFIIHKALCFCRKTEVCERNWFGVFNPTDFAKKTQLTIQILQCPSEWLRDIKLKFGVWHPMTKIYNPTKF